MFADGKKAPAFAMEESRAPVRRDALPGIGSRTGALPGRVSFYQ